MKQHRRKQAKRTAPGVQVPPCTRCGLARHRTAQQVEACLEQKAAHERKHGVTFNIDGENDPRGAVVFAPAF
jgi:hypothetical protein